MSLVKNLFVVAKNSTVILRKFAPNILTALSVVSTVGAVGSTVKATWDSKEIIEAHNVDIADIREDLKAASNAEEELECKNNLASKYADTVLDILDNYLATAIFTGASIASGIASNNISNRRIAALGASFSFVKNMFDKYRQRVKDKYGEEAESNIYHGAEKVEGKSSKSGKEDGDNYSNDYDEDLDFYKNPCVVLLGDGIESRLPDSDRDNRYNLAKIDFITKAEHYLTHRLNVQGYLFMSEIAEYFGIKPMSKAQHDIWSNWGIIKSQQKINNLYKIKREIAEQQKIPYEDPSEIEIEYANRVTLGLDKKRNEKFVNGLEPMFWLYPNIKGDISYKVYPTRYEKKYQECMNNS